MSRERRKRTSSGRKKRRKGGKETVGSSQLPTCIGAHGEKRRRKMGGQRGRKASTLCHPTDPQTP